MQTIAVGDNLKRDMQKYTAAAVAAIVAATILLGFINQAAVKRQLNEWKLLPQPERLSELYYENHATLPTTYTAGTVQSYSFTVHNLEYRSTTYKYTVTSMSEDGSQSQPLASGQFKLAQNAYKTAAISFAPNDLGNRIQITTALVIGQNTSTDKQTTESIHYWLKNSVQTKPNNPAMTKAGL